MSDIRNIKNMITSRGVQELQNQYLKCQEDSKLVTEKISKASAYGDLKENSEYQLAVQELQKIEIEMFELQQTLNLIAVTKIEEKNYIDFGAVVQLKQLDSNNKQIGTIINYQIVGNAEANLEEGLLSITTPLGSALLGAQINHIVEINVGKIVKKYQVLSFKYDFERNVINDKIVS